MRPIRLELQGFTAFREKCEIDFSRYDLFAIIGPTGAGKTSLLDAITYALYGKTSRLNKAGRELVSQGALSMSVLLHFRVGAEEYQVARAIRGTTVTVRLEKREHGAWRPAAGSISEVNDQIQRVVGLDFGGFTKTVILPQGKFDVFLRGEPKERREVLAELLDVEIYQRMMKSANEKSKDAVIRAEERAANIDAHATPEGRVESELRLATLSERERAAGALCERLRQSLTEAMALREKRNSLATSQGQLEHTRIKFMESQEAAIKARGQAETQTKAIEDFDRQLESTPYDDDAHLRLNTLLPRAQQQQKLREQLNGAQKMREARNLNLVNAEKAARKAREAMDTATVRLQAAERRRREAESTCKDLRTKHGSADAIQQVVEDLESARKEAADAPTLKEQIRRLEVRAGALAAEIEVARGATALAQAGVREAEDLYEQLHARDRGAALRHGLKRGEPCPVCEQTVHKVPDAPKAGKLAKAEGRVKQAKAELQKAEEGLLKLRGEAQGLPAKREAALGQLEARESRLQKVASRAHTVLGSVVKDPRPPLQALITRIRAAELDAQQAHAGYESALKKQTEGVAALQDAEHKKQLTLGDISNITDQIEACERELDALEEVLRGAPALEEITRRIAALEGAKKKRADLQTRRTIHEVALRQAEKVVVECGKSQAALESERINYERTIESLQKDIGRQERHLKKTLENIVLTETPDEATQIQRMEASSRRELEGLQKDVQRCGFEIEDLAKRIERNGKLREEAAQLRSEGAHYRDLGTWLNAGNFQQYLLGSAFDILAREGSRHLKELSGGRYEFGFEGDEFVVRDHSNAYETRSVRTLSGGESFLASLALALALAESITQLKGERGAVNLESLFLDEGFSTLDSETLDKVADAIEILRTDKRLIGIITHVQSLADQMPAQIEIEKTISGSRIAHPRGSLVCGV